MTISPLTAAEQASLAALADTLIPAAPNALSASQAGIAGELLALIETHAPERLQLIRHAITFLADATPTEALARLKRDDPDGYDAFCETIASAYFMAPQVRDAVGFPGRVATPARIDPTELEDLLLPVLEAGFAPRMVT